jgi:hypothetical protein
MSGTVQANDGAMLPLDSLPQTFAYSGGFISTITVQYAGNTYVQTFENNGTNITFISGWNNILIPPHGVNMVTEAGVNMVTEAGVQMVTE